MSAAVAAATRAIRRCLSDLGPHRASVDADDWLARATRSTGVGVWKWDLSSQQLHWDQTMWVLYGFDPETRRPRCDAGPCPVDGAPMSARDAWWSVVFTDDAERTAHEELQWLKRGGVLETSFRIRRPDGAVRHIASKCTLEHDKQGQPVRVIGINEDVTDQVERSQQQHRLRLFLEQTERLTLAGGWKLTEGDDRPEWTHGVFRIHDLEPGLEPTLEEAVAFYQGGGQREIRRALQHSAETGEAWEVESAMVTAKGRRIWVRVTGEPIISNGRCVAHVGAIQDLTVEHRIREELRLARAEAERANKTKTDFLASVSHELRSPLTAIIGYASLAREEPDRAGEHLGTIERNGDHLLAVINDLLDITKAEAGSFTIDRQAVELAPLVADIAGQHAHAAERKGVSLSFDIDEAVPREVVTDATRVRQILHNLVGNAVKFTVQGGIRVGVGFEGKAEDAAAGTLVFRVADTGIGMTAEQLDRVFRPYEQAHASIAHRFGGTGLGLAVTQRLASLLGGRVEAESDPGLGTTFTVRLDVRVPLDVERPEGLPTHPLPAASLEAVRVLVVDDTTDARQLVGRLLEIAGAVVVESGSGLEAERLIREGSFDLILTDLQMPDLSGEALIGQLRSRGIATPIVAVTAQGSGDAERSCLDLGCQGFVRKPIDREELLRVCAQAVGERTHRASA